MISPLMWTEINSDGERKKEKKKPIEEWEKGNSP